mmetsp:Transcript_59837/g.123792  ORF Transcript_59837/g.123792 Transcript_59837/m.123792 type:complete len:453 (+) Transcript_59837:76-1434(+)
MAALFLAVLLAGGHAFRHEHEQLEDEDFLPRLRAFDETGLQQLENGERLPLTISSFAETNASFPEIPYFWRKRLTIVQRLGSGAFGEVFKCKVACSGDDAHNFVTLKLIKEKSAFTDREIGFLKKMNEVSDYCVSAIGSPATFHTNEGTWLLMPYLNGGDFLQLAHTCGNKGKCRDPSQPKNNWDALGRGISNAEVLALFHQVVQGVDALHSRGIIHTDIKLENAMLSCREGECFASVIDLGLGCEPKVTRTCGMTGTPTYLAPEVWKTDQPRSAMTSPMRDVWSLGVMLYLLMYPNFPPFIAGTAQNVAQNTLKYKPEQDPNNFRNGRLDFLIGQMLEPDPRNRATIEGVLGMLEAIIKKDYAAPPEVTSMIDEKPVDRGANLPVSKCLFDKLDYDVGDKPFEREMCLDQVTEAEGVMRCGICIGCNPCCKCRVLRHGQKVKEHFRQRVCE